MATSPGCSRRIRPSGPATRSNRSGTGCRRPCCAKGPRSRLPWLTAFLKNPAHDSPGGPAADAAVPLWQVDADYPRTKPRSWPTSSPRRDRAEFPYQTIPEQNASYLAERNKAHPDYLAAGWLMMTNKASPCLQCHAIGQFKPSGGDQVVNGPDLREVAPRFRPDLSDGVDRQPAPAVPFTAMPQNIAPHGTVQILVPKTFENQPFDMVKAVRDTLLNYVNAVELQLASSAACGRTAGTPPKTSGNAP